MIAGAQEAQIEDWQAQIKNGQPELHAAEVIVAHNGVFDGITNAARLRLGISNHQTSAQCRSV